MAGSDDPLSSRPSSTSPSDLLEDPSYQPDNRQHNSRFRATERSQQTTVNGGARDINRTENNPRLNVIQINVSGNYYNYDSDGRHNPNESSGELGNSQPIEPTPLQSRDQRPARRPNALSTQVDDLSGERSELVSTLDSFHDLEEPGSQEQQLRDWRLATATDDVIPATSVLPPQPVSKQEREPPIFNEIVQPSTLGRSNNADRGWFCVRARAHPKVCIILTFLAICLIVGLPIGVVEYLKHGTSQGDSMYSSSVLSTFTPSGDSSTSSSKPRSETTPGSSGSSSPRNETLSSSNSNTPESSIVYKTSVLVATSDIIATATITSPPKSIASTAPSPCSIDHDCPAGLDCDPNSHTCFVCTFATFGMSCSGGSTNCCDPWLCINSICTSAS